MNRKVALGAFTIALVAAPAVAQAAVIGASYKSFSTSSQGWVTDSDRWAGSSTGQGKICGDVVGSSYGGGGEKTMYRDVSLQPDPYVTYASLIYSDPYRCGSLVATSSNQRYYTAAYRVQENTPHSGYVDARNSN